MTFQIAVLSVMIPALKRYFGDDQRNLWSYAVPASVLGLELAPCLLIPLRSDMATLEFWGQFLMQEVNSVAKKYRQINSDIYVAVRAWLGRAVDGETLKLMDEKRSTIAPCDNLGKITSPVVLMATIGLESAIDSLPSEQAPYFATNGILGGWRNKKNRGEAPAMLVIIFCIRIEFCWVEIEVRARQRIISTARTATQNGADDGNNRSRETESSAGYKSRRSSMAVLYDRVVRSDDAHVHMQYLAGALFLLQPILFVLDAVALVREISE